MESDRRNEAKSNSKNAAAAENVNIEDFEHELVRFCSLKSALEESEEQKKVLEQ
ncbi:unnamed protein product [Rhodiola kirilowii]